MENLPENSIIAALRGSSVSMTILQIAEKCQMHRVTAAKYLAVLEAKGLVKRRDAGKAKLYSLIDKQKES